MARAVKVGEFQSMQRAGAKGPNHVGMGEMEGLGDAEQRGRDVASVDPMTGKLVDAGPALTVAEQLGALELHVSANPPYGEVIRRLKARADLLGIPAGASDIDTEARRRCGMLPEGDEPVEPKPEDRIDERLNSVTRSMAGANIHGIGPYTDGGPNPDYDPSADPLADDPRFVEPTEPVDLTSLGVKTHCTAEMPLSLIRARVLEASYGMHPAPSNEDIDAEADRIWRSFDENRAGPAERKPDWRQVVQDRVVEVGLDGVVVDVREPEMTPDRGPDVGTTTQTITDEEPRFSGAGADDSNASGLVPNDSAFRGKLYREAPELANIAEELIQRHGFLEDLQHCDVRWYWKRKTGVSKGRVKIGFMKRASDLLGHFSGADFIGWLSATTARDGKFTSEQVEAAVFHQLLHIGSDDKGNWIFLPHDFEGFAQEVRHYGTWTEGLKLGGTAFVAAQQMGLFDATDEDEDDEDLDDGDDDDVEAYDPAEDGEDVAGEVIEQVFSDEPGHLFDEDRPADPDQPFDEDDGDPLADHDL